ncbi:hypothetical protein JCM6882_005074 [Rhodosporidiobolus microsporus]
MDSPATATAKQNRPKRTYRACQPCRARKLKCDLGDPDNPSEPPCKRCRRESRDCVFVQRANAKSYLDSPAPSTSGGAPTGSPYTSVPPQRPKPRKTAHSVSRGSDPTPGPSAARAAAHPYAQSPSGWGPSPEGSSGRAASTTPGEVAPTPQSGFYYPPSAGQTGPNRAQYDPNFPLIPHLAHSGANSAATIGEQPGASQGSPPSPHSDGEDGDRDHRLDDDDEDDDEDMDSPAVSVRGGHGVGGPSDANVLLSSTLHNPSDALKLLATASSLRSLSTPDVHGSRSPQGAHGSGATTDDGLPGGAGAASGVAGDAAAGAAAQAARNRSRERRNKADEELNAIAQGAGWERWVPVKEGMLTPAEAEVLLSFFQDHMAPLYPLLSPRIFSVSHLPQLTSRESLLLASMITISARYSSLPSAARARAIHLEVADYINAELIGLLDGSGELRHISSVEALLLLTEWPPISDARARKKGAARGRKRGWGGGSAMDGDEAGDGDDEGVEDAEALLRSSAQYDAMSWSFIGCAVRLAQELGIQNLYFRKEHSVSWQEERCLRTWIYCYNADRHVSVRLGRNAVIQAYMSSSWWEQVTSRASQDIRGEGLNEVWAARSLPQGLIAALMGTIQERLYPDKEITRSMLRTGHWESFVRSLDHELQMMLLKSRIVLQAGNIESTLLQMEFEYTRLYGNAIALRALQERLRRAVKAHDLLFVSPSLLNLQEGQWVLDALAAAQSILEKTVNYLAPKGFLRVAPSRIFQRILFAATFLFKALAVGVVEHGQSKVMGLLDQCISVLYSHAVDRQHIARGFAALLRRLQAQCKPTLLSRFGVRPIPPPNGTASAAEAFGAAPQPGATPAASHAGTPAASYAPSPRPQTTPQLATVTMSNNHDPLLAPTPGPSLPGSASATPRVGFPSLPTVPENGQPHPAPGPGAGPSPSFSAAFPHGYPASSLGFYNPALGVSAPPSSHPFQHMHHPPWLATEPTNELGGFKLADVPGGFDASNPFEWDPAASTIQVGKEQDLLFQSLWGGSGGVGGAGDVGGGVNPALNLFGTLGLTGDEFGLE